MKTKILNNKMEDLIEQFNNVNINKKQSEIREVITKYYKGVPILLDLSVINKQSVNGAGWIRESSCKATNHKCFTFKHPKCTRDDNLSCHFKKTTDDDKIINVLLSNISEKDLENKKTTSVNFLGIIGPQIIENVSRPIRLDIKNFYTINSKCVNCGQHKNLVCDHKNDLYNDKRVLDIKTQNYDDFQTLCNRCNLFKQKCTKPYYDINKRFPASKLYKYFPDFISGTDLLDKDNPNTLIGTYWYDVELFHKELLYTNYFGLSDYY